MLVDECGCVWVGPFPGSEAYDVLGDVVGDVVFGHACVFEKLSLPGVWVNVVCCVG